MYTRTQTSFLITFREKRIFRGPFSAILADILFPYIWNLGERFVPSVFSAVHMAWGNTENSAQDSACKAHNAVLLSAIQIQKGLPKGNG